MSAANDVKLLCEAIVHFDAKGMKKFKYTHKNLYEMWTTPLINAIKENNPNFFSEEHEKKIGDAIVDSLKKVEISTKEVSEGKVEVTVKGLDIEDVFADNVNWQLDVNPGVNKEEFVDSVARNIEKNFAALQAAKTEVFFADCVYYDKEKFWGPRDMKIFLPQIFKSATGEE